MEKITFTCETITPMFLAGADGLTPELRPPSIKGALRFWWRAMNGHLTREELKAKEDDIFGGTDRRSKVLIRIIPIEEKISPDTFKNLNKKKNDLIYMAYGAEDRLFYDIGTKFKVVFSIQENNEIKKNEVLKDLKMAFSLLINLGGLGAKSRNGFGSLNCKEAHTFEEITANEIFRKSIMASYTIISAESQIYKSTKTFGNWKEGMSELKGLYSDSKRKIKPKPNRVYIGAPWKSIKFPDRHAKLHLMSLTKNENGYSYLMTFLPYKYLMQHPDINSKNQNSHFEKWEKTTIDFNESIEVMEDKNKDYLVDFIFKTKE